MFWLAQPTVERYTLRMIRLFPFLAILPSVVLAQSANFSLIFGGKNIGHVIAETKGDVTTVDYDVKNNGRGPTISEVIHTGPGGLPVEWSVKGTTTFGSKVEESFSQTATRAEWRDSTGKASADITKTALYVVQSGSPCPPAPESASVGCRYP